MATQNVAQVESKVFDQSISCISRTSTSRGKYLGSNYFDVPDQEYAEGFLKGAAIAHELFAEMKHTKLRRMQLVMNAAGKHLGGEKGVPSKRGAAAGLYRTVLECVELASGMMDLEALSSAKVNEYQTAYSSRKAFQMADKAEFVVRMAQARKAKREACKLEVSHA